MSPPPFSKNVLNVYSTGQMQIICFLFVNAEIFSPLQHGQLQLFYCCKFTSRIDNQRLLLDEEIFLCFLPCERDPSWSGLAVSSCDDCIILKLCGNNHTNTQCSLSVHIQQTLHWFYHTKHADRNDYAIIINFYS